MFVEESSPAALRTRGGDGSLLSTAPSAPGGTLTVGPPPPPPPAAPHRCDVDSPLPGAVDIVGAVQRAILVPRGAATAAIAAAAPAVVAGASLLGSSSSNISSRSCSRGDGSAVHASAYASAGADSGAVGIFGCLSGFSAPPPLYAAGAAAFAAVTAVQHARPSAMLAGARGCTCACVCIDVYGRVALL